MSQTPHAEVPLPMRLSRLIMSAWVPQAIYTATALGIPDQLADRARRSDDVARAVGAPAGNVHRLLRALVMLELCTETDHGVFELTELTRRAALAVAAAYDFSGIHRIVDVGGSIGTCFRPQGCV